MEAPLERLKRICLFIALSTGCAHQAQQPPLREFMPYLREAILASGSPRLRELLDTTDYDDETLAVAACAVGRCIECPPEGTVLRRDRDRLIAMTRTTCREPGCDEHPRPANRADFQLAMERAEPMGRADPVDACAFFRAAEDAARCSGAADLEERLAQWRTDHPRACLQADLFAADEEVIEVRKRLSSTTLPAAEREALREKLNAKRLEYRRK